MALSGNQKRHLRALGHHLDPVVQIGKHGITEALVAQLAEAIAHHELIKVKLLPECPVDRNDAGGELAKALGAELAQTLGRTLLLFKRNPQAAKVTLPRAGQKKVDADAEAASKEPSKGKLPPSRAARAARDEARAAKDEARRQAAERAKERAIRQERATRSSGGGGGGEGARPASRAGGARTGGASRTGTSRPGGARPAPARTSTGRVVSGDVSFKGRSRAPRPGPGPGSRSS